MGVISILKNMAAKKTVVKATEVVEEVVTPETPTVGCENCEFDAEKAPTCSMREVHTCI